MIFSGAGFLVFPLMFLGLIVGLGLEALGVDMAMAMFVGVLVSAVLMVAIGRYFNAGDPFGSTFFFVPLEYWALFPAAIIVVGAVQALFE